MSEIATPAISLGPLPQLVRVASFVDIAQADLAWAILDANGIESWLENAAIVHLQWLYSDAVGGIKLLVRVDDAETAFKLLSPQVAPQEHETTVCCEKCGEVLPQGWVNCWRCSFSAEPIITTPEQPRVGMDDGDPISVAVGVVILLLVILYGFGPWVFTVTSIYLLTLRYFMFKPGLVERYFSVTSCPIEHLDRDEGELDYGPPDPVTVAAKVALLSLVSMFMFPFLMKSAFALSNLPFNTKSTSRLNLMLVWILVWIAMIPYLIIGIFLLAWGWDELYRLSDSFRILIMGDHR